jgi:hypothetical protein
MVRGHWRRWVLGLAIAAGPVARAETPPDSSWQPPEHMQGSVVRVFKSDGTPPAVSKRRSPRVAVAPISPGAQVGLPQITQPPVEGLTVPHPVIQTLAAPEAVVNLSLPRLPHGHLDPTHPAGPAEPGSAAPLPPIKPPTSRPTTAGYGRPLRR